MNIGMGCITKGVGRQAGYYKWRDGGSEGVSEGEGGRILRMKELRPLYQLYLIYIM